MIDSDLMLTERILQAVDNDPGITSAEIFKRIDDVERKNISATLCNLVKQNRLDRTGEPRNFLYFPAAEAPAGAGHARLSTALDDTTDAPAAPATDAASTSVRTIVAPEMKRSVAATARRATGTAIAAVTGAHTDDVTAHPTPTREPALAITSDGTLSIPTPAGLVTLDPEQTRKVGLFLMFTMGVWRGEEA